MITRKIERVIIRSCPRVLGLKCFGSTPGGVWVERLVEDIGRAPVCESLYKARSGLEKWTSKRKWFRYRLEELKVVQASSQELGEWI